MEVIFFLLKLSSGHAACQWNKLSYDNLLTASKNRNTSIFGRQVGLIFLSLSVHWPLPAIISQTESGRFFFLRVVGSLLKSAMSSGVRGVERRRNGWGEEKGCLLEHIIQHRMTGIRKFLLSRVSCESGRPLIWNICQVTDLGKGHNSCDTYILHLSHLGSCWNIT